MKKALLIGWKDVKLAYRDRAALILTLVAPFVLIIGMGFVTGHFSGGSSSGLSEIPVILVNQDGGQIGNTLVSAFQSTELKDLVKPEILDDPALARQRVDADQAAAAIIIPAGFTESIIPPKDETARPAGDTVQIEVYANPTRPTSAGVVKTIVEGFISQMEVGRVSGQVAVMQLISAGLIQPQEAAQVGGQIGSRIGAQGAEAAGTNTAITLKSENSGRAALTFDPLAYMAPGMALMFLMFAASLGGRSLLIERAQGTLPRLLVSPTSTSQVLEGKTTGTYLTGVIQMLILIVTSALLFQLRWGDPLAVLALVLAAVAGATGWGMLITAVARTPGQVTTIGSAITLMFGLLGGTFITIENMPGWFQALSKITPNAWGVQGFATLAAGGTLEDILVPIAALLLMGAILFILAVTIINRRGIMQ
jgi:ABC-2 type transport system permease protein